MTAPREARGTTGTTGRRASTPGAVASAPPADMPTRAPTNDEIETRAYYLWRETGRGDPVANWLEAEQQLRAEYQSGGPASSEPTQAMSSSRPRAG